jgi:hypothetical protein
MKLTRFFEESGERSTTKATIVAKYFWAWAFVIRSCFLLSKAPVISMRTQMAGLPRLDKLPRADLSVLEDLE